ncbi:MAG: amino acid amidase, partial [Clostridiales bacterium]|nr:amino acid amidase [Clostridiales bacterium]
MKVFISADMEGITPTIGWDECDIEKKFYSIYAEQMTREVVAACEGAINAGAEEIVIKDA